MVVWWFASAVRAQGEPITAIEELGLEELLNLEVDVATRTEESVRETAGLVTVLTAEDLRRAGCRDLLEALRLLPALEAGVDTWNTVGLSVRGFWAFESKVLVLIDGHEWNEIDYGTFGLGNRLPADAIERIEVIRGPGSAVYGGFASLAVVKVTTRALGAEGARVSALGSVLGSGVYGRQNLVASGVAGLGDDGHLGVTALGGRGRRTDDLFRSVDGREGDLTDASATDPALVSLDLRLRRFSAGLMLERYHVTQRDTFTGLRPEPRDNDTWGVFVRSALELPLVPDWTLTPRASFKWQQPWSSVRDRPDALIGRDRVDRSIVGVDLRGAPSEHLDLLVGGEAGLDRAFLPEAQPDDWFVTGRSRTFGFAAGWAQGIARTDLVQVTAGLRVDGHLSYGTALSPRLALTRAWEHAHVKLQVGRAFRAPVFQQSIYGVAPETSTTWEAELGAGPARWAYVTGSVFDVRLSGPIVYTVRADPDTGEVNEGYENTGDTGTRGGELAVEVREAWFSATVGYAGYSGSGVELVPDGDDLPVAPGENLGLPTHKLVGRASADVPGGATVGAVATWLGPRHALVALDAAGELVHDRLPAAWVLDLSLGSPNIADGPVGVRAGVHDLLDVAPPFVQPYDGGHAPLPSQGRELWLELAAEWR